jgi:hypothetical protein
MPQSDIHANDIHAVGESDELPEPQIEERWDGDKLIRFYLDADNEIEWLEIETDGSVLEIDPNHFDISAYRDILRSGRQR